MNYKILLMILLFFLTSCEYIGLMEQSTQFIKVDTVPEQGAKCNLENDLGNWTATTPKIVVVNKSHNSLFVSCKKGDKFGFREVRPSIAFSRVPNFYHNISYSGPPPYEKEPYSYGGSYKNSYSTNKWEAISKITEELKNASIEQLERQKRIEADKTYPPLIIIHLKYQKNKEEQVY